MSTSTLGLPRNWTQMALPILTGLLGLGGVASGSAGFLNPDTAPRLFGIVIDPASSSSDDSKHSKGLTASQKAYVQIHSIRNIGSGVSLAALTAFWQFSDTCQSSPVAAEAVKRALGVSLMCGTLIALGDSWILSNYAKQDGVSKEAVDVGKEKGLGHAITAVPMFALGLALFYT